MSPISELGIIRAPAGLRAVGVARRVPGESVLERCEAPGAMEASRFEKSKSRLWVKARSGRKAGSSWRRS